MKKVIKTLAIIVDVLCMPIRWFAALEVGIATLILYDDCEASDFCDMMRSNFVSMYVAWSNVPKYLVKIWKGEKIEIL